MDGVGIKARQQAQRKIPSNVHVFPLTLLHFIAAILLFAAAMVLGIRFIPDLARSAGFRGPEGWLLAHMMLLGWATLLAMGASFQLVQIILQTQLFSRTLGFVQFFLHAIGLAMMLPSLYKGAFGGILAGGSCVIAAVFLYIFNLAMTMISRRKWNVFVLGISLCLLNLLVTVGLGIGMGIAVETGKGVEVYEHLFHSHLWVGLGGWMSGLILTFIFKLFPMFLVSPHRFEKGAWFVVGLFQIGIWIQIAAVWCGLEIIRSISVLCLLLAVALLIRFIYIVRRGARSVGGTVPVVAYLIVVTAIVFVLWLGQGLFFPGTVDAVRWAAAFVVFLVAGCFSASILGFLARIMPFLWWAYRFHTKWQKKNHVMLSDMVPDSRLRIELALYCATVAATALSIGLSAPTAAVIGQTATVLVTLVYLLELATVFRH